MLLKTTFCRSFIKATSAGPSCKSGFSIRPHAFLTISNRNERLFIYTSELRAIVTHYDCECFTTTLHLSGAESLERRESDLMNLESALIIGCLLYTSPSPRDS